MDNNRTDRLFFVRPAKNEAEMILEGDVVTLRGPGGNYTGKVKSTGMDEPGVQRMFVPNARVRRTFFVVLAGVKEITGKE